MKSTCICDGRGSAVNTNQPLLPLPAKAVFEKTIICLFQSHFHILKATAAASSFELCSLFTNSALSEKSAFWIHILIRQEEDSQDWMFWALKKVVSEASLGDIYVKLFWMSKNRFYKFVAPSFCIIQSTVFCSASSNIFSASELDLPSRRNPMKWH